MSNIHLLILNGKLLAGSGQSMSFADNEQSLSVIEEQCQNLCTSLNIELEFKQSDDNQQMATWIEQTGNNFDAIIINPGINKTPEQHLLPFQLASDLGKPVIEVHLNNIFANDPNLLRPLQTPRGSIGFVCGLGSFGYLLAINSIIKRLNSGA